MTTTTITTTYSVGDTAYAVITGSVEIKPVKITAIHLNSPLSTDVVSYTVVTADSTYFNAGQSELYAFADAKTALLAYLNSKITLVTNMVTPPVI